MRPDRGVTFKPGPFYLGKWGYLVNAYAVTWTCLETVILCMPQLYPVVRLILWKSARW